ncbi:MAG: hypothetical protein SFH39_07760 [Candidatus Magnetobacterium sp. LHC-1]
MRHKFLLTILTVVCIGATSVSGMCWEGTRGAMRGAMKAAASDACSGKSAGDSCTFTCMSGQSITGTCKEFNSQTSCVPEGGPFSRGYRGGMFNNQPVVDANGIVYVTKLNAQNNSVVQAITIDGSTVSYTSDIQIRSLVLSGDGSALVAVGGSGAGATSTTGTSTISVIPLPLTATPAVVNIPLTGRLVSAPTVKNNLIYAITFTRDNSTISKTLTVTDLSGKTLYSGAI